MNPTQEFLLHLRTLLNIYSDITGSAIELIRIQQIDVSTLDDLSKGKKKFVTGDIKTESKG